MPEKLFDGLCWLPVGHRKGVEAVTRIVIDGYDGASNLTFGVSAWGAACVKTRLPKNHA
jgi:hypothetical protein